MNKILGSMLFIGFGLFSSSLVADITPGLKWVRVQQVHHDIKNAYTFAYLEAPVNEWIACKDKLCIDILVAAVESGNSLGVNFTGTTNTSFDYVKLYKN